jgi:hypothetical protein
MRRLSLFLAAFIAAAIGLACVKGLPARMIQGSADACAARARELGDKDLELACQTASDLAPLLDLISARRVGACRDAGTD